MSDELQVWNTASLKALEDEKIAGMEARFISELKRIEAVIAGQERAVTLLGQANQIAQDKFEATVKDGFVKQNEFRGSLDDLGKSMATRRELETYIQESTNRYHTASVSINARIDETNQQLADLRSRIDIGPSALRELQNQAAAQQGRQAGIGLSANVLAVVVTVVIATVGLVAAVYFGTNP